MDTRLPGVSRNIIVFLALGQTWLRPSIKLKSDWRKGNEKDLTAWSHQHCFYRKQDPKKGKKKSLRHTRRSLASTEKCLPQPLHCTIFPLPHPCSLPVCPGPFLLLCSGCLLVCSLQAAPCSTPGKHPWQDICPTPSICPSTSKLWLRTKPMDAFMLRYRRAPRQHGYSPKMGFCQVVPAFPSVQRRQQRPKGKNTLMDNDTGTAEYEGRVKQRSQSPGCLRLYPSLGFLR